ncbi:hypothetical protein E4U19_002110 [Claviceps sp. Clav32 group G5]|nr:hypothetical protein E4U40_005680 [Claviceps sp. LM458 group G5]KAG6027303.1 hypothetical protein E4U19_002110 [Claviceps sp. Clav32 group G5]KAG6050320.1 hypothetical protein E4U39_004448 [Claviceps sp. Clav50 group G5]
MHALSLLALLLPFVVAKKHDQCDCMSWTKETGWIHNKDLSHWVCKVHYAAADYGSRFDVDTGRCVADGDWKIDGQDWENACIDEGHSGYFILDDQGYNVNLTLYKVGAATGDCKY